MTDCYKNHDNMEEIHVSGANLNMTLPTECYVCGEGPITYADVVILYTDADEFIGAKRVR